MFSTEFYPAEKAVLDELITSNNLIQPVSDLPIDLESFSLLRFAPYEGGTISTIETEENCLSTFCRIVSIDFTDFNITHIPESFSQLTMLKSLTLANNNIEEIPVELFGLNDIEYLDISLNQISEINNSIGSYTNLNYLNISSNNITELPSSLSLLPYLSFLDASQNMLTEFNSDGYNSLESIFIGGNKISELDEFFCELDINWIDGNIVDNNHLCSNIPSCIVESNSVGAQDCNQIHNAFLQSIINQNGLNENSSIHDYDNEDLEFKPVELGYQRWEFGQLIELNLSSNPTNDFNYDYDISFFPSNLSEVSTLKFLDLGNNQLSSIPSEIGYLTDLISLKYDNNYITGNLNVGGIPSQIGQLNNLKFLSLANNYITIPNSAIYSLTALEELYLNNNQIYYVDNDLGNLENLKILNLSNNDISSIPNEIRFLDHLNHLNVSFNQITSFNTNLRYLGELLFLDLGNNYIQEIPTAISQMLNLREIRLNNNQLSALPNEIFTLGHLRKLHLQYNSIFELQDNITNLIHLEELKLHYNQLPELPQSICQINEEIWSQGANEINDFITLQQNFFCFNLPGCISSHEQVDEIIGEQDCYGSDIQVLSDLMTDNDIFGNPANFGIWENERLVELNLSGYGINHLPENLGYLAELRNLDLSDNNINIIPSSIEYLINIDSLKFSNNLIDSIPNVLHGLNEIKLLDLSSNSLRVFPEAISSLSTLTELNLSHNLITHIPPEIENLENLHIFNSSNNMLINIPEEIGNLSNISKLNMSYNHISNISESVKYLSNLTDLSLEYNQLDSIPDVFHQINNLVNLDISYNNLVELPTNFFNNLNIEYINLSNNNLLRLPQSVCNTQDVNIDLNQNYLFCSLGVNENQYYGYMDEDIINECILSLDNLIGLDSDNQGCEYYGCTADQGSPQGEALNFDEEAQMSCSSDGTYNNQNDCCLYVQGPNIYVRPDDAILFPGSDISGDGSFESPFSSINKAIRLAARNDTIIIDVGEYYESIDISNKDSISIVSFAFSEIDQNLKNYYIENTVINGNNFGSCLNIFDSGNLGKIMISGLTVKNGRNNNGGGFNINNSKVELDEVLITQNTSTSNGGGLFVSGTSEVYINNSIIDTNLSLLGIGYGGGVYLENNSKMYLRNTDITRNKSNSGGGLYLNNNNQVVFDNCKVSRNRALDNGGGIFNTNDSLLFLHYITNIASQEDTVITTIENNYARNGAGLYQLNSSASIIGLIVKDNEATENGGGFYINVSNTSSQFSNIILTNNSAQSGGGIFLDRANLEFYHITSFGNLAENGSEISINGASEIAILNSIIWNNYSNDLIEYSIDTDFNLNYSILSHEYNGDGNKFLYPEFSNLENFNLSRVSNALGAGEYNSNIPITDIYGNTRIDSFEGNYQSIDIGAIEFPLDSIEYKNWFVSYNGNDNNNGDNPNLPFKHINYAVSKALNGDRIYIQNGTYNENILFNGKNVKLMNKRYYDVGQIYECGFIEDSFIEDLIIEPLNNTPVIQILEGENNVELCGFTITDGEANNGSGIFINNANPTIHSINIVNNYSLVDGGGLYGDNFNGQLHNIKIIGNISAGNGAGIFLNNSSPSLKNILISENMNRVTNYNLNGGGMYLSNSNISNMEYVTFSENHASNNGGGLYLDNCTIEEAIGFEFYSNFSNKDGGAIYSLNSSINFEGELLTQIIQNVADINGGAIYANASNINATSVQINENFASQDGGGIYVNNGSIIIMKDSELNSNTALEDGGAIYMNGYDIEIDLEFCSIINNVSETTSILYANNGKVNMKNILIEGNRSTNYPGGILSKNSDISLFNITITNNNVLNPGAGGNLNIENYGKLNLVNSIVWDNDGVGVYLRDDGSHKSFLATHSNLSNGRQGINHSTSDSIYYYAEYNYSSDPKFISPEEGFYYITKESHCVDAGISLFPPNAGSSGIDTLLYITEDEMVDGNGDGIKMPDIGAYDKRILSVYPGDLNHDGSVNIGDILNIIKYFNIKGIPRYSKGINWKEDGYGAVAWNNYDNISGLALTYTDANGDGVINERDLLSIGLNWENSHPFGVTGFSLNMDEKDIIENHSLELNQLYNSLSGQGDGFSEIKSYLESLLNLSSLPIKFDLGDNYPNPFNPITFIPFSLAENSLVSINIFDLKGKLINEFMSNKKYNKGYHKVKFNADDLPSGLYFYSIKTNNWVKTKKMMLVK